MLPRLLLRSPLSVCARSPACRLPLSRWRPLSTTVSCMATASPAAATTTEDNGPGERIYQGPLTPTFRRLKILSLSSLGATTAISPFFFIIESNLPTVARISLAGIAVTTSLVSTAMVSYFTRPYVTSLRRIPGGELEITTYSLFLKPLITKIYDTDFLADTQRPFAKWQLPTHVLLPESQAKRAEPGTEETVAETFNGSGERIGSWVVKWEHNGEGNCHALGSVVRYFNVHLELLDKKD